MLEILKTIKMIVFKKLNDARAGGKSDDTEKLFLLFMGRAGIL